MPSSIRACRAIGNARKGPSSVRWVTFAIIAAHISQADNVLRNDRGGKRLQNNCFLTATRVDQPPSNKGDVVEARPSSGRKGNELRAGWLDQSVQQYSCLFYDSGLNTGNPWHQLDSFGQ